MSSLSKMRLSLLWRVLDLLLALLLSDIPPICGWFATWCSSDTFSGFYFKFLICSLGGNSFLAGNAFLGTLKTAGVALLLCFLFPLKGFSGRNFSGSLELADHRVLVLSAGCWGARAVETVLLGVVFVRRAEPENSEQHLNVSWVLQQILSDLGFVF